MGYTIGIVLFVLAVATIFGTDMMVKKGRLTGVKEILIAKAAGTVLLFAAIIALIIGS